MGVGRREFQLKRDWILYPDDPTNGFALLRAWDRHLVTLGLLPVGTPDLTKVGPILLGPKPKGKTYLVYRYNDLGHLVLREETLRTSRVQKASRKKKKRVSKQVP